MLQKHYLSGIYSTDWRYGKRNPISNVHFGAFVPVSEFFETELGVNSQIIDMVISQVKNTV